MGRNEETMPRAKPTPKKLLELRRNIYADGEFVRKGTQMEFDENVALRLIAVGKAKEVDPDDKLNRRRRRKKQNPDNEDAGTVLLGGDDE
jgi:hypothetical protein